MARRSELFFASVIAGMLALSYIRTILALVFDVLALPNFCIQHATQCPAAHPASNAVVHDSIMFRAVWYFLIYIFTVTEAE